MRQSLVVLIILLCVACNDATAQTTRPTVVVQTEGQETLNAATDFCKNNWGEEKPYPIEIIISRAEGEWAFLTAVCASEGWLFLDKDVEDAKTQCEDQGKDAAILSPSGILCWVDH